MRRFLRRAAVLAALLPGVSACTGYGNSSPTGPNGTTAPPEGAVVINVLGINGSQSFSPNPATVPSDRTVVWHNVDTITHRVVFDDGEVDTGNIAPGAFSAPKTLVGPGPYHCSIHPPMVGSVSGGQ